MNSIQIVKGEDKTILVTLLDEKSGEPYDLAGVTSVKMYFQKDDDTALEKTATIVSSDAGKISVALSDTETATLKAAKGLSSYIYLDKGSDRTIVLSGLDRVIEVVAKPF